MLKFKFAVITLMLVLVAGCASNTVPDPEPGDETFDAAGAGADTDVYGDDPMGGGEMLDDDYTAVAVVVAGNALGQRKRI